MEPVSKLTLLTEKESFSTLDEAHIYLHKPLTCGRDPYRNDLVVPSPHASRHHFEIYCVALEDGPDDENQQTPLVFLHCLNSSNGVLVNGKRLRKARGIQAACLLCHRDIIEVVPGLTFRRELQFLKEEYTVSDRCIGNGANAQVFLGENCQTFDQVAVKINKLGCDGIPTLEMKRALQEAEMLGRLDHPNIVSCQRAFKTHIGVYIFLELASGGDLFSLILRRKWFTESEICVIIHQVMIAVQYIHSQGIVHRDIKPENILFAVTPRIGHRIVLTDFGSAGMVALGRLTSRVGTEYYRPPECRKCAGLHDRAADLWAAKSPADASANMDLECI
ncbi:hypothetical protein P8C59_005124 [Phyllachora maydis]|uniref:Uncharacterized protein n=1 Tax=Phyllachora maydis TaxID=1825666 RepID=A0AAD9I4Z6_9PEZI|nr:hypothetical protein P8C59_005124 [Phyllachora maydis]